jgi:hypothetical protein
MENKSRVGSKRKGIIMGVLGKSAMSISKQSAHSLSGIGGHGVCGSIGNCGGGGGVCGSIGNCSGS